MSDLLADEFRSNAVTVNSRTLAGVLAFFAGCPVLLNLFGTYIADGESFAITAGGTFLALALGGLVALRLGTPQRDFAALHGPVLALSVVAGLFWADWFAITLISPSPQEKMANLPIQSLLWYSLPMSMAILWRRWIDLAQVARILLVMSSVYVAGLTMRYLLGLGHYHSGRWHAGDSLESIRSGHYAASAIWVFIICCCAPAHLVPRGLKLLALFSMPFAVFMVIATNSRGPTLALGAIFLFTSDSAAQHAHQCVRPRRAAAGAAHPRSGRDRHLHGGRDRFRGERFRAPGHAYERRGQRTGAPRVLARLR